MDVLTQRSPRVVSAVRLHRAAGRRKAGLFLAEGVNAVSAAISAGDVRELFVVSDALGHDLLGPAAAVPDAARPDGPLAAVVTSARAAGIALTPISPRASAALSEAVTPQGVFAVCASVNRPLAEVLAGTSGAPRLVAVAVGISDPGNAGTLIRIADAVGAGAVIFAGDTVDPHNGKAVRSSAGSIFHIPIVREPDASLVLSQLRLAGLAILATAADGEVSLDVADGLLTEPTAWLFGNEAHGLSEGDLAMADHRVQIPLRGRAESLNLATAAAICLYASSRVHGG